MPNDRTDTALPSDLILVQDTQHHYSLQVAKEMTVDGNTYSLQKKTPLTPSERTS